MSSLTSFVSETTVRTAANHYSRIQRAAVSGYAAPCSFGATMECYGSPEGLVIFYASDLRPAGRKCSRSCFIFFHL